MTAVELIAYAVGLPLGLAYIGCVVTAETVRIARTINPWRAP